MPTIVEAVNLARQHHHAGRLPEAEVLCRQVLQAQPDHLDALHLLGMIAYRVGQHAVAIDYLNRAIALDPQSAELHNDIGRAYRLHGKLAEAEIHYRQALTLKPAFAEAHNNLGNVLQNQGKYEEAVAHYRQALALQPALVEVHKNLGRALYDQGNLEEAEVYYRQVLAQQPASAEGFSMLGTVLLGQLKLGEAEACYRQALTLNPASAETHMNLGTALHHQFKLEEAEARCRHGLALNPTLAESHVRLGNVLKDQGKLEDAKACYRHALTIQPQDGLKIVLATMLPEIYSSTQDLRVSRRRFEENVDALLQEKLTLTDPVGEVRRTQFLLPYQGMNDRELQKKVAQLYERACPSLLYTAPHCPAWPQSRASGKIKIGFISRFLFNHSIGKYMRGVFGNLSREKFCVYAIFVPPFTQDEYSGFFHQQADKAVFLPNNLSAAREIITAEKLDVLFYPEIGMEPMTYFLAFARLAPVQCVSFGHPITTGIRNMDYFISSENFETKSGEKHYSEQLVRLKSPVAHYFRPKVPARLKSRGEFGLDDNQHIYFCPQALFKFHPDFDEILAGILNSDPQGRLVLKAGNLSYPVELLLQRFKQTMGHVMDRITVLPLLPGDDFMNLIAVSDVMLDTIHFSGYTTSMEAFAVGTPIVTMAGEFQRSRHTQGLYKEMGVLDCVADSPSDYVKIAVRLGTDAAYRKKLKAKILKKNQCLYEDPSVVKEYERVFLKMAREAGFSV